MYKADINIRATLDGGGAESSPSSRGCECDSTPRREDTVSAHAARTGECFVLRICEMGSEMHHEGGLSSIINIVSGSAPPSVAAPSVQKVGQESCG